MKYIFTSEKVMAYVYWLTHKFTNEYYIGYHMSNVGRNIPSHLDIGTRYFTSSTLIESMGFENFDWIVFAEFFTGLDAYNFEQGLLKTHIGLPGYLNKKGGGRWNTIGLNPFENKTEEEMANIQKLRFESLDARSEEKKLRSNKLRSESYANKSQEEQIKISKNISDGIVNKTHKERLAINDNISNGLRNRNEEEKRISYEKHSFIMMNRSPEEKALSNKLRAETVSLKSEEERQIGYQKQSATMISKSPEEKALIAEKQSIAMSKRTEEERKETQIRRVLTLSLRSDEEKELSSKRLRAANLGIKRKKIKCPHCEKEGAANVMGRYHFDNCKKRTDNYPSFPN